MQTINTRDDRWLRGCTHGTGRCVACALYKQMPLQTTVRCIISRSPLPFHVDLNTDVPMVVLTDTRADVMTML